jgi:hypothetical protein
MVILVIITDYLEHLLNFREPLTIIIRFNTNRLEIFETRMVDLLEAVSHIVGLLNFGSATSWLKESAVMR